MHARLTAFVPDNAAINRSLSPGKRLRIGRSDDCELLLTHPSISRFHAELVVSGSGWRLTDLGSKNGSYVDGAKVSDALLESSCWLRFGDVHCEFSALDASALAADARRWHARHDAATAHTVQLAMIMHGGDSNAVPGQALLEASLRAVAELAGCTRGFLLIEENGQYGVRASLALDPAQMVGREFAGSLGAVTRAIEQRKPVIFNDIGGDAWPGGRASVVQGGLRTLVCLPLLDGERVIGAIYSDRCEPGPPLTTLDLELLQAFADRTALWLAAHRASDALVAGAPVAVDWGRILAGPAVPSG